MRKRLVLAVVAVSLLLITPVDAQTDLERAREDVAETTQKLEDYLADLEATQARGDELARQYWQVQSGLERLDLDIAMTEAAAAELGSQVDELRVAVRVIAVDQYVSRSEDLGVADHASEADRTAAETLARLVVGSDIHAIDQLAVLDAESDQVRVALEEQRAEQQEALVGVEATQASIGEELDRLGRLRGALAGELEDLEQALADLEQAESNRQAAEAEQARIEEERRRAEEAAAAAAAIARRVPTPAPTPVPTAIPNPQLPDPTATPEPTAIPNPQLPDPTATPEATSVPNPQPSEPFPTSTPPATSVPNPQLPEPTTTAVPNPQPSEPFPTATPLPTAVPNPQPSTPIAPAGGGIVCPLAGPFTHTDDFNSPRAVGGVHRANDLISDQGTPVLAAASGTVEHRDSRVGGMSVHLKGDNGDYYFYTHLSGYENVGAGWVAAGAVVGYVGMTGNAPIPHLHFEIHRGGYGNYTNPYGPVRAACF